MSSDNTHPPEPSSISEKQPAPEVKNLPFGSIDIGDISDLKHQFWCTQPVPSTTKEMPHAFSQTSVIQTVASTPIRTTPLDLPPDLEWSDVDVNNPSQIQEVHDLLAQHYVEDSDAWFRFDYSSDSLRWATQLPGTYPEWTVCIRTKEKQVMVGFISAVPQLVVVHGQEIKCVVVDFLCVHKKLRSKRLAPLLISEIRRRVNCRGIFQAIYTGLYELS